MKNITSGFHKTGIYPLTGFSALSEEIFNISETTMSPDIDGNSIEAEQLKLPKPKPIEVRQRKTAAQRARLFNEACPVGVSASRASTSGIQKTRKQPKLTDNNVCQSCNKHFKDDAAGESWIQCLSCKDWFHELCQGLMRYEPDFQCRGCREEDD